MVPRRVLLRIKKLRRFLDDCIRDAVRRRETAGEAEARAEAAGRAEAFQRVRDEMVGERLDPEEIELPEGPEGEDEDPAAEPVEDAAEEAAPPG